MSVAVRVLQYTALLAWLVFVVWYHLRARWERTPTGRNVMGTSAALVALLALVAAAVTFPDYPGRPVAQLLVYASLTALGIQRTVYMERAQRHHPHD